MHNLIYLTSTCSTERGFFKVNIVMHGLSQLQVLLYMYVAVIKNFSVTFTSIDLMNIMKKRPL